ncbi:MAG: hypothetical protein ABUS57_07825 [Pseudomonadota bacterium]
MHALIMALACAGVGSGYTSPKEAPLPTEERSAADTHWSGSSDWNDGDRYNMTVWFRADGVVVYAYGGQTYDNGHWRQRGPVIVWDTNDLYAVYAGQEAGDEIQGATYSANGANGHWELRRDAAQPPAPAGH